jgi:hypothetical protein
MLSLIMDTLVGMMYEHPKKMMTPNFYKVALPFRVFKKVNII